MLAKSQQCCEHDKLTLQYSNIITKAFNVSYVAVWCCWGSVFSPWKKKKESCVGHFKKIFEEMASLSIIN